MVLKLINVLEASDNGPALIRAGTAWLETHGHRRRIGHDDDFKFIIEDGMLNVEIQTPVFQLYLSPQHSKEKYPIIFPEKMRLLSDRGITIHNGSCQDFGWLSSKTFPKMGNFRLSACEIGSFKNLPVNPPRSLSIGPDCILPKSDWQTIKRYDIKHRNIMYFGVQTDKTARELANIYFTTKTLLEFQSALIDADLESYF
jgi:hypothetical protein